MNNKGFTLIELLAVIAIIAMLTTIITPSVTGIIKKNKVNVCESLVKSIENAANNYVSDHRYDSNITTSTTFNITLSTLKSDGYIKNSIKNPLLEDDKEENHLLETVEVTYNSNSKTFNYKYKGSINCNS
jgi:prepilin-type N-terminal cleavage/methylation domain-containing protein